MATVVAVLFLGVMLPAVEMAREAGRRSACAANQARIGGAILAWHESHGMFPVGLGFSDAAGCPRGSGRFFWTFTLLPLLGHEDAAAEIGPTAWGTSFDGSQGGTTDPMRAFRRTIPVYRCPSDGHVTLTVPNLGIVDHTQSNYVACFSPHGFAIEPEADPTCLRNHQLHGGERTTDNPSVLATDPFLTRPGRALFNVAGIPRRQKDVTDGTSRTMMLSEVISGVAEGDYRGTWWSDGGVQYSHWHTPNHPGEDTFGGPGAVHWRSTKRRLPDLAVRPGGFPALLTAARSNHPGTVVAAAADGSVRVVRDDVAAEVWTALGSIDGGDRDAP